MRITSPAYKTKREQCSIEISDTGIAYAHIFYPHDQTALPILKECAFFPLSGYSHDQLQTSLTTIANKYNLKGVSCNWLLTPNNYRLLLTNTPNVAPEEYKVAVRWQIKDMIDYPIEDTTLDIFIPSSFSNIDPPKLYVTVAQSSFLRRTSALIKQALFNLTAIDIREFALRNLLSPLATKEKSLGFLCFGKYECLFVIVKNDQLYLARSIPFGTEAAPSTILAKLPDEVQRSLDYYNSELKQDNLTAIFIPPATQLSNELIDAIKLKTSLAIHPLPLDRIVKTERETILNPATQRTCYLAIGGALRKNEAIAWNKT